MCGTDGIPCWTPPYVEDPKAIDEHVKKLLLAADMHRREESEKNFDRVCLAIFRALTWNLKGMYRIYLEFKPTKDTIEVTIYTKPDGEKRRDDFQVGTNLSDDEITNEVKLFLEDNDI